MSGNRHQIKATCLLLGNRKLIKWVIRAVVMLGFWEGHCLYLVLGMWFISLMHGSNVSVNRAASQMWLEPLGSELLLVNRLIFAACKTSWTMQSKVDVVLWWENAGVLRCHVCGLYVGVSLSTLPAPKSWSQSCWALTQLLISRVWCVMKGNAVV